MALCLRTALPWSPLMGLGRSLLVVLTLSCLDVEEQCVLSPAFLCAVPSRAAICRHEGCLLGQLIRNSLWLWSAVFGNQQCGFLRSFLPQSSHGWCLRTGPMVCCGDSYRKTSSLANADWKVFALACLGGFRGRPSQSAQLQCPTGWDFLLVHWIGTVLLTMAFLIPHALKKSMPVAGNISLPHAHPHLGIVRRWWHSLFLFFICLGGCQRPLEMESGSTLSHVEQSLLCLVIFSPL